MVLCKCLRKKFEGQLLTKNFFGGVTCMLREAYVIGLLKKIREGSRCRRWTQATFFRLGSRSLRLSLSLKGEVCALGAG